jgi:putative Mg2+ transporter-C (MgtC) family protein
MSPWWELLLRMVLAGLVGGLIGWEREARGKPAGFRTLMLVSLAAAIYVMAAQQAALSYGEPVQPGRAMAGIAQGIGFLGAGAILQSRGEVRWLTTAAALWAAAALGLAAGLGMYFLSIAGGILVFATLHWLALVEERWVRRPPEQQPPTTSEGKKNGHEHHEHA